MDQRGGVKAQLRPIFTTSDGSRIVGYLPAGVVVWGGLGKLFDHWLGTSYLTPCGLVLGSVLAMYLVIHHCVVQPRAEFVAPDHSDAHGSAQEKAIS